MVARAAPRPVRSVGAMAEPRIVIALGPFDGCRPGLPGGGTGPGAAAVRHAH